MITYANPLEIARLEYERAQIKLQQLELASWNLDALSEFKAKMEAIHRNLSELRQWYDANGRNLPWIDTTLSDATDRLFHLEGIAGLALLDLQKHGPVCDRVGKV